MKAINEETRSWWKVDFWFQRKRKYDNEIDAVIELNEMEYRDYLRIRWKSAKG